MPRATLEFDLPDDLPDFNLANHGGDWWAIVSDLDQTCHNRLHREPGLTPDAADVLKWVREFIRDAKVESGLIDPP